MLASSFLGGWLFQFLPTRIVLVVGVAASIAGTVLMVFAIGRTQKARPAAAGIKVKMKR